MTILEVSQTSGCMQLCFSLGDQLTTNSIDDKNVEQIYFMFVEEWTMHRGFNDLGGTSFQWYSVEETRNTMNDICQVELERTNE